MKSVEENKNYCTLYLVRHGETEWNIQGKIQGHLDSPLTELGAKQAEERAENLKTIHFDAVFSSDLPRAVKTAEILKLDRELLVQTSELLRETKHGAFEGRSIEEFREAYKDKLEERERLSEEERHSFKISEDVESDRELMTRFLLKLREIAVAYPNKTVLVVGHGYCLHAFLIAVEYAKRSELPSIAIDNLACIKILCDGVDFIVQDTQGVKKFPEIG